MAKKTSSGRGASSPRARTSPNCDKGVQHGKGIRHFITAGIFLIASLIVGLAVTVFSVSEVLWLGASLFVILGWLISIGFWVFLILGFLAYFRCDI